MGKEDSIDSKAEETKESDIPSSEDKLEVKNIPTKASEESEEKKEDVEKLRRVIKIDKEESSEEKIEPEKAPIPEQEQNKDKKESAKPALKDTKPSPPSGDRAELEQKRDLLQNIKDFDFQIKKNQESIGNLTDKLDGVIKDLDDLVSLYEIVSEQMNPFVGLSKVTKKRIDALENFTKEIEDLKTRMGDLESEIEQGLGGIKHIKNDLAAQVKAAAQKGSRFDKIQYELQVLEKEKETSKDESEKQELEKKITELQKKLDNEQEKAPEEQQGGPEKEVSPESKKQIEPTISPTTETPQPVPMTQVPEKSQEQSLNLSTTTTDQNFISPKEQTFTEEELDALLSKSLEAFFAEQNIDTLITDFLLTLK